MNLINYMNFINCMNFMRSINFVTFIDFIHYLLFMNSMNSMSSIASLNSANVLSFIELWLKSTHSTESGLYNLSLNLVQKADDPIQEFRIVAEVLDHCHSELSDSRNVWIT